jgi:hypothetical protein
MMQQLLVLMIVLLAAIYLLRHVYQLFFAANSNCQGCGLTPKEQHETDTKSTSLPI